MKKFIKFCALTGLILLLAGIGITSVSAALGGRFTSYFPRRIWSLIRDSDDYREHVWEDDEYPVNGETKDGWTHWNEKDLQINEGMDMDTAKASGSANPADGTESAEGVTSAGGPDARLAGSDTQSGAPAGTFSGTRKLDIDVDKCTLRVYEKEGISQIEINVNDKYNATRCYMDKETLKIKREQKHSGGGDIKIEVLVPQGYQFDKVSVDLGAAECHLTQIHTDKLDIDTGVGAVTFAGTVTGKIELETGVGDVVLDLTGKEQDYNYKIECGVGTIQVGSTSYSALSHDTVLNNNAPYNMELECGVGTITVNFNEN